MGVVRVGSVCRDVLPRWCYCSCQCRRCKKHRFNLLVEAIPWRRKWQLTPVFLPGESHGQRSLMGYSPWGRRESDSTESICTGRDRL